MYYITLERVMNMPFRFVEDHWVLKVRLIDSHGNGDYVVARHFYSESELIKAIEELEGSYYELAFEVEEVKKIDYYWEDDSE